VEQVFVGVDWGNAEHAVCVLDAKGDVKDRRLVPHAEKELTELVQHLRKLGPPHETRVAIERPTGLLVDRLAEAGFQIVPIHPNAVQATRSRYTSARGKDDRFDAYILADMLRTDGHRFRSLQATSDQTRALKAIVRTRDDVVDMRVRAANQLRALLESYWAGAAGIFVAVDSLIALAFLKRYPTPESAKSLSEKRLTTFLKKHGYPGRRTPAELLERLRSAPCGQNDAHETEAKKHCVLALVEVVGALVSQCSALTSQLEAALEQHPDGALVRSFPHAGQVNAAQILAELGDDRDRFVSAEHLAAEAGVVPVTDSSGKRSHKAARKPGGKQPGVYFRRACNKRLRKAITCFADNSRRGSDWAAKIYESARARGCTHPHAVRVLARAWVRVLWRCWRAGTPYDVELHAGAKRAA
jgi:transposase